MATLIVAASTAGVVKLGLTAFAAGGAAAMVSVGLAVSAIALVALSCYAIKIAVEVAKRGEKDRTACMYLTEFVFPVAACVLCLGACLASVCCCFACCFASACQKKQEN